MDVHILLITWCNRAPPKNNHHHCTSNIPGTSACLLSPPKITKGWFFSHLSGFYSVFSAASSALLLLKSYFAFPGPLKPPSGIIASVDHADYSGYLSAVKALHLLSTPYKSISSKAFLCRSPGSFPPLMMNVLHFSLRRARQGFRCSVHILLPQCNVGGKTNEQQIWQNESWMGLFEIRVMKEKKKKKKGL